MKRSLRDTTYEDAIKHAEALFEALHETEEFAAVTARAAEAGITISTSVRHTYTPEFAEGFTPAPDTAGNLPHGYAMELWFDLVRDGHVLVTGGETPTQCSYGALAIDASSFLFFNRLNFRDLEDVLEHNPICAMLEEFFDMIDENGATATVFKSDALALAAPTGKVGMLTLSDIDKGAFTEISRTAYDGTFGAETSVYFAADAFTPYRLFLLALMDRTADFDGASLALDRDTAEAFADLLEEIPSLIRRTPTFTDLFTELVSGPLTPTPRVEQLSDALTVCRAAAFSSDCHRLAAFVREQLAAEAPITIIW